MRSNSMAATISNLVRFSLVMGLIRGNVDLLWKGLTIADMFDLISRSDPQLVVGQLQNSSSLCWEQDDTVMPRLPVLSKHRLVRMWTDACGATSPETCLSRLSGGVPLCGSEDTTHAPEYVLTELHAKQGDFAIITAFLTQKIAQFPNLLAQLDSVSCSSEVVFDDSSMESFGLSIAFVGYLGMWKGEKGCRRPQLSRRLLSLSEIWVHVQTHIPSGTSHTGTCLARAINSVGEYLNGSVPIPVYPDTCHVVITPLGSHAVILDPALVYSNGSVLHFLSVDHAPSIPFNFLNPKYPINPSSCIPLRGIEEQCVGRDWWSCVADTGCMGGMGMECIDVPAGFFSAHGIVGRCDPIPADQRYIGTAAAERVCPRKCIDETTQFLNARGDCEYVEKGQFLSPCDRDHNVYECLVDQNRLVQWVSRGDCKGYLVASVIGSSRGIARAVDANFTAETWLALGSITIPQAAMKIMGIFGRLEIRVLSRESGGVVVSVATGTSAYVGAVGGIWRASQWHHVYVSRAEKVVMEIDGVPVNVSEEEEISLVAGPVDTVFYGPTFEDASEGSSELRLFDCRILVGTVQPSSYLIVVPPDLETLEWGHVALQVQRFDTAVTTRVPDQTTTIEPTRRTSTPLSTAWTFWTVVSYTQQTTTHALSSTTTRIPTTTTNNGKTIPFTTQSVIPVSPKSTHTPFRAVTSTTTPIPSAATSSTSSTRTTTLTSSESNTTLQATTTTATTTTTSTTIHISDTSTASATSVSHTTKLTEGQLPVIFEDYIVSTDSTAGPDTSFAPAEFYSTSGGIITSGPTVWVRFHPQPKVNQRLIPPGNEEPNQGFTQTPIGKACIGSLIAFVLISSIVFSISIYHRRRRTHVIESLPLTA